MGFTNLLMLIKNNIIFFWTKNPLGCHRGIQVLKWKIIMSGLSFPNDELNQADSSPLDGGNEDPSLLHPIDEADDFYDPFSDLSLFLSKRLSLI